MTYIAGTPERKVVYAWEGEVAGLKAEIVRLTTIIARARIALAKDNLAPAERIADADQMLTAVHQQCLPTETKP